MRKNRPDTASPWWGDALTVFVCCVIVVVLFRACNDISFGDFEEAPPSVEEPR
jgi:hypothetical protein